MPLANFVSAADINTNIFCFCLFKALSSFCLHCEKCWIVFFWWWLYPTKLSYVSCYSTARRVHLAKSRTPSNASINTLASDCSWSSKSSSCSEGSDSSDIEFFPIARKQWKHKKRKTFEVRKAEAKEVQKLYPESVPIVLERTEYSRIPAVQKEKFLVPRCLTIGEFKKLVRRGMLLGPDASLTLLSQKGVPHSGDTIEEVYTDECDEDGFLYISYCIENLYDDESTGRVL